MLHLETGLPPLHIYTLRLHFLYIVKVMSLPSQRLPHIVAMHHIRHKLQFFNEWSRLCSEHDVQLTAFNATTWKATLHELLTKIDLSTRTAFRVKARQSLTRHSYCTLQYDLCGKNYFHDRNTINTISMIFKTRGELLQLNYRPHITNRNEEAECSLCNLRAIEDVHHLIGICPILKGIRRAHWGKHTLSTSEVISILNGQNWSTLSSYLKSSLKYRQQIVDEAF